MQAVAEVSLFLSPQRQYFSRSTESRTASCIGRCFSMTTVKAAADSDSLAVAMSMTRKRKRISGRAILKIPLHPSQQHRPFVFFLQHTRVSRALSTRPRFLPSPGDPLASRSFSDVYLRGGNAGNAGRDGIQIARARHNVTAASSPRRPLNLIGPRLTRTRDAVNYSAGRRCRDSPRRAPTKFLMGRFPWGCLLLCSVDEYLVKWGGFFGQQIFCGEIGKGYSTGRELIDGMLKMTGK